MPFSLSGSYLGISWLIFFFLLGCSLGSCQTTPSFAVSSQGLTKQMMKLPEEREGKNVESKCGLVAARVLREQGMSLVRLWQ